MRRIPNDTKEEVMRLYENNMSQKTISVRLRLVPCTVCRIVNTTLNYANTVTAEPVDTPVCAHFGCGKQLSLREQLFGNKCINHSKIKQ